MTLVVAVADRINAQVAALKDRIEYVAALAALVAEGAMPQREVAAFVVPLGFDDKGGDSAAGLHTQIISSGIGVILCIKAAGDPRARKALPTIDALEVAVVNTLAGWAPGDDVAGVLRVTRGRLVSVTKGLVIYQIDFELTDQLRVAQ
jgi:hypothetical protein